MLKKIISLFKRKKADDLGGERTHIIPRAKHGISRATFNESALKVLNRLHKAGFGAYLVGGCIRDTALGKTPKDFDVVTNAHPEEVKKLFSNCILIGKRFRLAHVRFGRDIIEVSTFRAGSDLLDAQHQDQHGMILRDNVYGTIEQDVMRRDFTINSLYYNIANFSLVDYVNGFADLKQGIIRIIGDPQTRYKEDPVRMLRAIRFAAKLDFKIEEETAKPIKEHAYLLKKISPARLFEEYLKLFLLGAAVKTYAYLKEYNLLRYLFPDLVKYQSEFGTRFVQLALESTDSRIAEDKSLSPAFLLSVFMLPRLLDNVVSALENGAKEHTAIMMGLEAVLFIQQETVSIPRKFSNTVREILELQYKLNTSRTLKKVDSILNHPRFRAAYDIMLLRAQAGDAIASHLSTWWTEYMEATPENRIAMAKKIRKPGVKRKKAKQKQKAVSAPVS
jgi:poly(A) polymerase